MRRRILYGIATAGLLIGSAVAGVVVRGERASGWPAQWSAGGGAGPIHVAGTIRIGAEAPGKIGLQFSRPGRGVVARVLSDAQGRFDMRLDTGGEYQVSIRTAPFLASTVRYVSVTEGKNVLTLDLPATSIRVAIKVPPTYRRRGPIQLYVDGPLAPTQTEGAGFVVGKQSQRVTLKGVGYGEFTFTASTPDGLTSESPARITLSPAAPHGEILLSMARRSLRLAVEGADGKGVGEFQVVAGAKSTRTQATTADASGTPSGARVIVKARGYLPECVLLRGGEGEQKVSLRRSGDHVAALTLRPGMKGPIGLLEIPGMPCGVPLTHLDAETIGPMNPDSTVVHIKGLPAGDYTYRAALLGPPGNLHVPGPGIEYDVPSECSMCSAVVRKRN